MARPNFFIIGAPKCGTTALCQYLSEHPEIFISHPKEPHFFAEDLPGYRFAKDLKSYLKLFDEATSKHKMIGEGSVYYLYSKVALDKIYEFNPQAKLIVMLRNPVDLVYSLHSQLLYSRNENIKDFQKAWMMQKKRLQGKYIPKSCTDPKVLQYGQVGMLGSQCKRLFSKKFLKDQILVILFEDFVRSTQLVYEEVLSFLNVRNDGRKEFPVINSNSSHKITFLSPLYVNTPKIIQILVKYLKKMMMIEDNIGLTRKIMYINTKYGKRRQLDNHFRLYLTNFFHDDINLLSNIINKDLSHWLEK